MVLRRMVLKAADVGVALVSASLVGPPPPSPDDGMFAEGGKGGKARAESLRDSPSLSLSEQHHLIFASYVIS